MLKYTTTLLLILVSTAISFAQPANDDCAGIIDLGSVPYCENTVFSNVDATPSNIDAMNNIPACFNGGSVDGDVWFQFDIPLGSPLTDLQITIAGTGTADGLIMPQLAIYRGDCMFGGLSELECVSAPINATELTMDLVGLDAGANYFLRINDYSASATPNWGDFTICIEEFVPEFTIDMVDNVVFCEGTLYDSGGADGDYQNSENNFITICPNEFHQCIFVNVLSYNLESGFDFLTFHQGDDVFAPVITTLTGAGDNFELQSSSDCITIAFSSDISATDAGFELTWECSSDTCTVPPLITCADPVQVPSLPYSSEDLSTCFAGNAMTNGPCPGDDFINGEDYIFAYDSPGDECISISLANTSEGTGIGVYNACPANLADCISFAGGGINQSDPTVEAAFLEEPGTYYIVIANAQGCSPFDITIDTTTCPDILPPAANCEDALSIAGCDNQVPSQLNIQQQNGDPDFFQAGVNDGCWGGVIFENYTWFYIEAQADGDFGFILSSADPNTNPDIDINVWGPFNDLASACDLTRTTQPIRSTWAAPDPAYDGTGLADIHPFNNVPVDDVCEGAAGDDFVSTIPVQTGEIYFILVNDYSGAIFDGALTADFGPTTGGVLDGADELFNVTGDTIVCQGASVPLSIEGGEIFTWTPAATLSCDDCPDPIATPNQTTTYVVNARGTCTNYTAAVDVKVYGVDAGPDQVTCIGEQNQITASSDYDDVTFLWTPADNLSCSDCPNPIVTATEVGVTEYIVSINAPGCSYTDTMVFEVINGMAPSYEIADDTSFCDSGDLLLGGPATPGVDYSWTNSDGTYNSDESNPSINANSSDIYYLTLTSSSCILPSLDSVIVSVFNTPTLNIANDTSVCQGDAILLGSTVEEPDVIYSWSPQNDIEDPDDPNSLLFPTQDATYTLTGSIGNCISEESVDISITPIFVSLDNPDTLLICKGTEIDLSANILPLQSAVIWENNQGEIYNENSTQLSISPVENIVVYAEVINNSCSQKDSIIILVDSIPSAIQLMPMDTSVCIGEIVTLATTPLFEPSQFPNIDVFWESAGGPVPDNWILTPDSLFNLIVQPGDSVTFRRIISNGICRDTTSATINVVPTGEIEILPINPTICQGDNVQLNVQSSATDDWTWTPTDNLSCTDCPDPIASPQSTTTYEAEGDFNGCPIYGSVTVNVINDPNLQFPTNRRLCEGESIILNSNDEPGVSYTWTSTDPNFGTSNEASPEVTPTMTTTYFLISDNGQCTPRESEITITVVPFPTIEPLDDITICPREEVTLDAIVNTNGDFSWSDGSSSSSIVVSPNTTTNYTVNFVDDAGCGTVFSTAQVFVYPDRLVDILATPPDLDIPAGAPVQLEAIVTPPANNLTYFWELNGNPLNVTTAIINVNPPDESSNYFVLITDENGCQFGRTITFTTTAPSVVIPNAFTPGSDGNNDFFNILFDGNIEVEVFDIFNRWGEKIYSNETPLTGWDGTKDGKPQPMDTYVYLIKYILPNHEEVVTSGSVTLIR